jgi:hypothetical protein
VELRPRGGIYVATAPRHGDLLLPPESWLTAVLAEGLAREIPVTHLHELLRRSVETMRLRATVIHSTTDQLAGICSELRDDYGLESTGVLAHELLAEASIPHDIRSADLLVTTAGLEPEVRRLSDQYNIPLIVVEVRADLIAGEWRLLLHRRVFVVVADSRFSAPLLDFFAGEKGAENIQVLVAGEDDLAQIPENATVYITRGAREVLGDTAVPGRLLPTTRLLSTASSRELIGFMVSHNLQALHALRRQ